VGSAIRACVAGISLLSLLMAFSGCEYGGEGDEGKPLAPEEAMFAPLTDRDSLFEGAPGNDKLPLEGKTDAVYPPRFDLMATQSPVRNQARRGVCSIFSTLGLMEHLYIKEGTISQPDFSEQFLQWSAKVEVGSFKNTEGSSAQVNLDAIHRYGVVAEGDWPYETSAWSTSNDPACTGEDRPVICYTNGSPPESALAAQRFKLPRGRYVNSSAKSIKAVMTEKKVGVIAGMDFFYQSWNHGGSELPVNRDYFSEGYVLYPNADDKELSLKKRAGHSILLVGWDDDLEVPVMDKDGKQVLKGDGTPVTEKGFFLFKNSWGTGGFGMRNPFGTGYGWLSYRYVAEYANVYTSDIPVLSLVENCSDGKDNNFNNLVDCLDPACKDDDACRQLGQVFANSQPLQIPDNGKMVFSTIDVPLGGQVSDLRVKVDIRHPYIGDLVLAIVAPGGKRVVLHDRKGGSDDDIRLTYRVEAMEGVDALGAWRIELADKASGDVGTLQSWSLELSTSGELPPEICDDGLDNDGQNGTDCADPACAQHSSCTTTRTLTYENTTPVTIPDGDPAGELSEIEVQDTGIILSLKVSVNITHPYRGDLRVAVMSPKGTLFTLVDQVGGDLDDLVAEFDLPDVKGEPLQGSWILEVMDLHNLDSGVLNSWGLEATVQ
jgi:subtilisin-like proprotein convertase family protein